MLQILFLACLTLLAAILATLAGALAGLAVLAAFLTAFHIMLALFARIFAALHVVLAVIAASLGAAFVASALSTLMVSAIKAGSHHATMAKATAHLGTSGHELTLYHLVGAISSKLLWSHYLGECLEVTTGAGSAFFCSIHRTGCGFVTLLFATFRARLVAVLLCLVTLVVTILRAGSCLVMSGSQSLGVEFKQFGLLLGSEVVCLGHAVCDKLSFLLGSELGALLSFTLRTLLGVLCHHCGKPQNKAEAENHCTFHSLLLF